MLLNTKVFVYLFDIFLIFVYNLIYLKQGNSESDKYRFNTEFLTGSDYYRYPNRKGD